MLFVVLFLFVVTLFCCYIIFIFICVCCILFASFLRSFFVRATYLRIQGRMHILRLWTEIFKNEVLQRWGGLHSTQNKKCYIEMGLNFWGVLKKCRKRPANSAFRILVSMSMVIFLGAKPCVFNPHFRPPHSMPFDYRLQNRIAHIKI